MSEQVKNNLNERVTAVIGRIRPFIQADGGDIELVSIEESSGKVAIRFKGACRGCPSAAMTLKMGVERHLKEQVPEINEVVSVP
jgi:Fe-S cluster biogenesis protein NfuA